MNYFEAPQDYSQDSGFKVFLAGGIGNCPDWQADAVELLKHTDITILNPRRPEFPKPWTTENSREQITWEYQALEAADAILFWFPKAPSMQPIALFELGSWARQKNKHILIGRDPEYMRADDIDIQLGLLRPELPRFSNLSALCDAVEEYSIFYAASRGWS